MAEVFALLIMFVAEGRVERIDFSTMHGCAVAKQTLEASNVLGPRTGSRYSSIVLVCLAVVGP